MIYYEMSPRMFICLAVCVAIVCIQGAVIEIEKSEDSNPLIKRKQYYGACYSTDDCDRYCDTVEEIVECAEAFRNGDNSCGSCTLTGWNFEERSMTTSSDKTDNLWRQLIFPMNWS